MKGTPPQGAVEKVPRCGKTTVIPAKAGIHFRLCLFASFWAGSESGTKTKGKSSGFRIPTPRNNKLAAARPGEKSKWIPAFAGMTASW